MCGITGIINLDDDEINFSLLKKMSGCLSHRGPDESGFFLAGAEFFIAEIKQMPINTAMMTKIKAFLFMK